MKNVQKYKRSYFTPDKYYNAWAKKEYIDKAPIWCSVDLRDGNQALEQPMCLKDKVSYFCTLVGLGFKEIEVGFPAASETEYEFLRTLIEDRLIPDDVTIQVLTQSREHIIKKTFEALEGVPKAIIHLYNSTSLAQRKQVFQKSKSDIVDIAVKGAELLKKYSGCDNKFTFEYSPESFTGTEMDFAKNICNAVIDVWRPTKDHKAIINLPSTVSLSLPHIFASQIEYMCKNLDNREALVISVHPHNDRGCAVADAELGLLAGAERIEGTLFGNGERTGNVDIVTLALNMFSHGIDPGLNFENIPELAKAFSKYTGMSIHERHPYSGRLVFAAFSGSHQDAIAKGIKWRKNHDTKIWNVPYLPIDPTDIGRDYDGNVIRINSQSGKGGIGYILENRFSLNLPKKFREIFSYEIKNISDGLHKELTPDEIYKTFMDRYVNLDYKIKLVDFHVKKNGNRFHINLELYYNGEKTEISGEGNGRLDATGNAIQENFGIKYTLFAYTEHALEKKSTSEAVSYVGINMNQCDYFGVGIHSDIITSSILALISALNRGL